MKRVSNQSSGLVRKSKEIANGLFEFGLAFHQLGQSEGEALGKKLQLVGSTADTLSALSAQYADAEMKKLEGPFKDYLKTIHAVKLALGRRHDKRVSYTALLHEIQTREVNLHRMRMSPGREAQAYSTEMSIQRYQAAAEVAREDYAECSQRVLREVDRFKREKAEEMKMVVLEFIMLEIELNRCMEKIWGELVPKLEEGGSVVVGGDTGGGAAGVVETSQPQQPTVNMPPPVPTAASSQPTYSNIPVASDPMMESSIQYRDNTGMGL
jgi:sorting nexin-1/2